MMDSRKIWNAIRGVIKGSFTFNEIKDIAGASGLAVDKLSHLQQKSLPKKGASKSELLDAIGDLLNKEQDPTRSIQFFIQEMVKRRNGIEDNINDTIQKFGWRIQNSEFCTTDSHLDDTTESFTQEIPLHNTPDNNVGTMEQGIESGGDTYNINTGHVSLGNKAQHASRDIITQEPEKGKGRWELVKKLALVLTIIVSLIAIFGAYNKYTKEDKPAIEQIKTANLPGSSVDVNNTVYDILPKAYEIIAEIESLSAYEQKAAAENYIGRLFKWSLRFENLVHEQDGTVYVICQASAVRGEVSFTINPNAKENLKIKKIKNGKFLDVSGEIENIFLFEKPQIRLKDVRLEFFD